MVRTLKKGEILIKQDDINDKYLYIVLKGNLSIHRVIKQSQINCGFVRQGAVFGEIAMITGAARGATIIASEDGVIVEQHDKKSFLDKIKNDPEIAWRVLNNLAVKTQRLNELEGQISNSKILRKILLGAE